MKKGITTIFLLMFFVLSFNMVSAVKPITEVNTGTDGLQIFYPQFDTVKFNTTFNLHLHISNISNGVQYPNDEVDCYIHLYDMTGAHLLERDSPLDKDGNGWDHELTILGGNFTEDGESNAFYIWCNNTAEGLGGEVRGVYTITGNGKDLPGDFVIVSFSFIMLFLFVMIIVYIIRAIGLVMEANLDILDVAYAWGLYFGLLGLNRLAVLYLGTKEIMDWLNLFVTILGFPLIVVPLIFFFLSLFNTKKAKKKKEAEW